jgi:hypothetical protein
MLTNLLFLVLGAALAFALITARGRRSALPGISAVPGLSPPDSRKAFFLGGRAFRRIVKRSVVQDECFTELVEQAGLKNPDIGPTEKLQDYSERIFGALHRARLLRPMIAVLILPAEVEEPLTDERFRAIAAETAVHLGTLEEPEDKARFYALVAELLVPFYRTGLASWARSAGSGAPSTAGNAPAPAPCLVPASASGPR